MAESVESPGSSDDDMDQEEPLKEAKVWNGCLRSRSSTSKVKGAQDKVQKPKTESCHDDESIDVSELVRVKIEAADDSSPYNPNDQWGDEDSNNGRVSGNQSEREQDHTEPKLRSIDGHKIIQNMLIRLHGEGITGYELLKRVEELSNAPGYIITKLLPFPQDGSATFPSPTLDVFNYDCRRCAARFPSLWQLGDHMKGKGQSWCREKHGISGRFDGMRLQGNDDGSAVSANGASLLHMGVDSSLVDRDPLAPPPLQRKPIRSNSLALLASPLPTGYSTIGDSFPPLIAEDSRTSTPSEKEDGPSTSSSTVTASENELYDYDYIEEDSKTAPRWRKRSGSSGDEWSPHRKQGKVKKTAKKNIKQRRCRTSEPVRNSVDPLELKDDLMHPSRVDHSEPLELTHERLQERRMLRDGILYHSHVYPEPTIQLKAFRNRMTASMPKTRLDDIVATIADVKNLLNVVANMKKNNNVAVE